MTPTPMENHTMNTDDIVARLRNSCDHLCVGCTAENAHYVGLEAADEIERLRAEVARLGSFLHPVGMLINTKHGAVIPKAGIEGVTDEEVNEYLKVVRGG